MNAMGGVILILKIIIIVTVMLIASLLFGMIYTRFIEKERDGFFINFVAGFLILLALFQVVVIPSIIFNASFELFSNMLSIAIILGCLYSLIINRNRLCNFIKVILFKVKGMKRNISISSINVFVILILILIFYQMCMYLQGHWEISGADASIIRLAFTTIESRQFFAYNPYTGLALDMMQWRDVLSPYPMFFAYLSNLFSVHPAIFIRNIVPVFFVIYNVSIYCLIGNELFENDRGSSAKFVLIMMSIITLIGIKFGVLDFSISSGLHFEDIMMFLSLLPLGLYFYLKLIWKEPQVADWIMFFIYLTAMITLSFMGFIISTIMLFVLILLACVKDVERKYLRRFNLIIVGSIYFFTLASWFAIRSMEAQNNLLVFWMLLILLGILYALVKFEGIIVEKKIKSVIGSVWAIFIAIVIGGNAIHLINEEPQNMYRLPNALIEIIEEINEDAFESGIEIKRVYFPVDMLGYIRQYDSTVVIPLGRYGEKWDEHVSSEIPIAVDTAKVLQRRTGDISEFIKRIREEGINYIVVRRYCIEAASLKRFESWFIEVGEVDEFIIYRNDSFYLPEAIYDGVDYSPVFDYFYYIENNPELIEKVGLNSIDLLRHFINYGMAEGRRGSFEFNVYYFKQNYPRLVTRFGDDYEKYFYHYLEFGVEFGMVASRIVPILDGINYELVFDFDFFTSEYPEIAERFEEPEEILRYFVDYGMARGMRGNLTFDVFFYREQYSDLEEAFGDDLEIYYMHYILHGHRERRQTFDPLCYRFMGR